MRQDIFHQVAFIYVPHILYRVKTYDMRIQSMGNLTFYTIERATTDKQYIKLFEMDGITLTFDTDVLDFIVDKAVEYKLGARGLRSIVEAVMMDAMFEIPSKRAKQFKVTLNYAKSQLDKAHLEDRESA